jgi:hypothetical protein
MVDLHMPKDSPSVLPLTSQLMGIASRGEYGGTGLSGCGGWMRSHVFLNMVVSIIVVVVQNQVCRRKGAAREGGSRNRKGRHKVSSIN